MRFRNCTVITVFERTIDVNRLEAYIPHHIYSVYWELKHGVTVETAQNNAGLKPSDSLLVLIPTESLSGYLPKPGDRIVKGELAQLPDMAYTVREVFDARYGQRTQHVEVRAV